MSVFAKQFSDVCDRLLKGVPEPFRNHTPLACYRETLYQTLRKDADFIDAYNGDDSDETIIEGLRRILAKEPAYGRIPFWRMPFTVEAEDGKGAWCRIGHWSINPFTHQVEHFGNQGRNPLPASFIRSLSLCGKEGDEDVHIWRASEITENMEKILPKPKTFYWYDDRKDPAFIEPEKGTLPFWFEVCIYDKDRDVYTTLVNTTNIKDAVELGTAYAGWFTDGEWELSRHRPYQEDYDWIQIYFHHPDLGEVLMGTFGTDQVFQEP